MNKDELIEELAAALADAKAHLDWIGWGDSWERECVRESKLEEKINTALQHAKEHRG